MANKERKYHDLIKMAEDDPFGLLFGRYWMRHAGSTGAEAKDSQQSGAIDQTHCSRPKTDKSIPKSIIAKDDEWAHGQKTNGDTHSRPKVVSMENDEQEYEIDAITMRKVPKPTTSPTSPAASKVDHPPKSTQEGFDIPIKRFCAPSKDAPQSHPSSKIQTMLSTTSKSAPATPSELPNAKSWLAQEGFSQKQEVLSSKKPALNVTDFKPRVIAPKIESALDRHLKQRRSSGHDSERSDPQVGLLENTTDDVDLLRPSDVRARAGLRARVAKESNAEKQARQQRLEEEFDKRPDDREFHLAQEIAAAQVGRNESKYGAESGVVTWKYDKSAEERDASENSTPAEIRALQGNPDVAPSWMNPPSERKSIEFQMEQHPDKQSPEPLSAKTGKPKPPAQTDAAYPKLIDMIKSQLVPLKVRLDLVKADYEALRQRGLLESRRERARKKATELHEGEVKAQKQAMEAMEMRATHTDNVVRGVSGQGEKKPEPRQLQSFLPGEGDMASNVHEFAGRDRWYKRKAPHAVEDAAEVQKRAKDRELIREVRSIYEDTYGIIDTKHRQPPRIDEESKFLNDTGSQLPPEAITPVPSSSEMTSPNPESLPASSPESSEALATIQDLFDELRQAQTLIQSSRSSLRQSDTAEKSNTLGQATKAYEHTVLQIAKSALKLANASPGPPGSVLTQDPGDVNLTASPQHLATSTPPLSPTTPKSPAPPTLSIYRILAYDPSTQKVILSPKTTTLSQEASQPLNPVSALSLLNNPGKFLPHIISLQNKGYAIVSGAPNVLVFKREAKGDELDAGVRRRPNPVDGTMASTPTATTGNFASPTGFVNHDWPISREELEGYRDSQENVGEATEAQADTQTPNGKVTREEEVFSGGRRGGWQENSGGRRFRNKGRRRKERRWMRMLATGTVTAAFCYAIGVVSEMVRH